MKYLFDTNFLIGLLRKKPDYILKYEQIAKEERSNISSITVTELFAGCRESELERTELLISKLAVIPIGKHIAKQAGKIIYHFSKRGKTIHREDAIIGVTAQFYHFVLITQNIKDFPMLYPTQIEEFPG